VYDRGMGEVSAFVLVGGQSTRMGTDKALIELDGRPLIARALAAARSVTPDVRILGSEQKFANYGDVVEDQFPNHGPLGGIHAALRASSAGLNLIVAVDMPFVEERFLQFLIDQSRRTSAVVTVPRAAGNWQPLCAVYRLPFADFAEHALQQGKNKIDPLFTLVELCIVEEAELEKQGFSREMFRNLNTPEELQQARLH
jgi:molybdenum cofactor guanylyltransferase